jgi:hypothetical protein
MVAALPARSVGRKQRAGFKQSAQTRSGSRTNGGHAMLVVMAHSISDSQKQSADGAANAKQWLMHMRTKVCLECSSDKSFVSTSSTTPWIFLSHMLHRCFSLNQLVVLSAINDLLSSISSLIVRISIFLFSIASMCDSWRGSGFGFGRIRRNP